MPGKPLIGVSTRGMTLDVVRQVRVQLASTGVPDAYLNGVLKAEGIPVLLPFGIGADFEALGSILDNLQGILLIGGEDIDPSCYGGVLHEHRWKISPERDTFELALTRMAVSRGIPLFGICRGLQVLNVALGGTLVPHIEGHIDSASLNPLLEIAHDVRSENPRFSRIYGADSGQVNSAHHQAVGRVAEGLEIAARASDGTVEALIHANTRVCAYGVQWHPEYLTDEASARLFRHFVERAGARVR